MNHLLLISHFFPPMGGGGVQRVAKFVKYLEPLGWRTTVVAGHPEDYWMQDDSLENELGAHTIVHRRRGWSGQRLLQRFSRAPKNASRSAASMGLLRHLSRLVLIPDSYIGWRRAAMGAALEVIDKDPPQAMLSTSPPETNHLVGRDLKRRTGIPWVADFRDPWIGLHLIEPPTRWHSSRQSHLEGSVVREADAILATTNSLAKSLRQRGSEFEPPPRVHLIRNGYDPDDFPTSALGAPENPSTLSLLHTGMLTMSRSAESLLRALHLLFRRRPELAARVKVTFIGTRESNNQSLGVELGLSKSVEWLDYVTHAEAVRAMQEADVLLLIKHTAARYDGLIPGKFYEYLGAHRPILALVPESEAADLIRELGCGRAVAPDDDVAIARAIEEFYDAKQAGRLAEGYRFDDSSVFQRPSQARSLAEVLHGVCQHSEARS